MTKVILLACTFFLATACFATRHIINVANFQFTPANTNARVGDTIIWVWKSGSHTSTSLTIPKGARAWDSPINSSHTKFGYVVTKTGTYNFECSIHPSTMQGTIKVTAALDPNFSLNLTSEKEMARLGWNVTNPDKINYFSIEKSSDGIHFSPIKTLTASSTAVYNYMDGVNTDKFSYYQVRIIFKDGSEQLSDIKMFTATNVASKLIVSIIPNPVTTPGHLQIIFNANKDGRMHVQLYSLNGELLNQTDMDAVKGINSGHFHLSELKSGTYYVVCTLGNIQEKRAIVFK